MTLINPKISILIPTKNHAFFLEKCVKGISEQTYKNIEILIFNDGSTDSTEEILIYLKRKDKRLHYFTSKCSLGPIERFNFLLTKSSGDVIWGVGSDDFCVDLNFLQQGVAGLHKYPNAAGFFAAAQTLHMPINRLGAIWSPGGPTRYIPPHSMRHYFFNHHGTPAGATCCLKRKWLLLYNGWLPDLGPQCDYFLNNLAGCSDGFYYIANPVVYFRVWDSKTSFSASQDVLDGVKKTAKLEKLLRINLPGLENREELFKKWRLYFIIRQLNLFHLRRIYKRKYKPEKLSTLKGILVQIKSAIRIYEEEFYQTESSYFIHIYFYKPSKYLRETIRFPIKKFLNNICNSVFKRLLKVDCQTVKKNLFYK